VFGFAATVTVGTAYYASIVDVDNFRLHPTKADALAVTNTLDLLGMGGGTPRCHFAYYYGDVVWAGSLTILGTTSSRAFVCELDLSTALPTVANWLQLPADGVYELTFDFGATGLDSLNYDQSFDEWTLCRQNGLAYTLSREVASFPSGSSATANFTKFVFRAVDPAPGPPAPTLSLSTRVFGENYLIGWASLSAVGAVNGTTAHTIIAGDVVYLELTLGDANAITGLANTPGYFLVTQVGNPAAQNSPRRAPPIGRATSASPDHRASSPNPTS
jgi:hypothetical protein